MFEKTTGAQHNSVDTERSPAPDQPGEGARPDSEATPSSSVPWFRRGGKAGAVSGTAPKVRLAQLVAQAVAEIPGEQEEKQPGERHDDRSTESFSGHPGGAAGGAAGAVRRRIPNRLFAVLSRRRLVVVIAVLLGIGTVTAATALIMARRPSPEAAPALPAVSSRSPTAPTTVETTTTGSGEDTPLVVSVVGKVTSPGLITISSGARVAEAIDEAGGAEQDADLLSVNLARRLTDGEQLYVGVPKPAEVVASNDGSGASNSESKVDLNQADQEALEKLPGVGEVTSQDIVDWREENGGFSAVEQLREVDGIGEKRLERLRDKVAIE